MLLKSDIAWAKVILHSEKKKVLKIVQFKQKTKQTNSCQNVVRVGCGPRGCGLLGWGRGWGGVGTEMGWGETSRAYNKMVMAQ